MTRHDADHDDERALDAFLNGEDELSAQLRGLDQPAPPPALDARIRARAQDALRPSAAAANDADDAEERALVASPLGRWRAPLALAATVVIGVSLGLQWDGWHAPAPASLSDVPQAVAVVPPAPAPAPAPAPQAGAEPVPAPAPPAREAGRAERVLEPDRDREQKQGQKQKQEREREQARAAAREPAEAPPAPIAPPPPPAPPAAPAPKAAPAFAPAYSPAAGGTATQAFAPDSLAGAGALYRAAPQDRRAPVQVAGASNQRAVAQDAAAERRARRWLQLLGELLDLRLDDDARTSWRHFRAEYPDYPVPPALRERLDALPAGGD